VVRIGEVAPWCSCVRYTDINRINAASHLRNFKQVGRCTRNLILRHVRVTVVAVQKQ
jgi:hypothetical protein